MVDQVAVISLDLEVVSLALAGSRVTGAQNRLLVAAHHTTCDGA
jgi:hypothetical protein